LKLFPVLVTRFIPLASMFVLYSRSDSRAHNCHLDHLCFSHLYQVIEAHISLPIKTIFLRLLQCGFSNQ